MEQQGQQDLRQWQPILSEVLTSMMRQGTEI
jgi:hypothetical protein